MSEQIDVNISDDAIIVEGDIIRTMEEAYLWLRAAWEDEPYNMWFERNIIFGEPVRGYEELPSIQIMSLREFEDFVKEN